MKTCQNPKCGIILPLAPEVDEKGREFCGENCKKVHNIHEQRTATVSQSITPNITEDGQKNRTVIFN